VRRKTLIKFKTVAVRYETINCLRTTTINPDSPDEETLTLLHTTHGNYTLEESYEEAVRKINEQSGFPPTIHPDWKEKCPKCGGIRMTCDCIIVNKDGSMQF
jgi:hypothetical protein